MTAANTIQLDQLDSRARTVWSRTQTLNLLAGLLAFSRWAIGLFLLAVLIDWMTYMPTAGRVVMLIVLLVVSLVRGWRCGWCRLKPFNAVHAALELEAHHGQLNSLLVSAIQLRNQPTAANGSAALRERTCRMAEEAAAQLRPEQAVPYQPLRQPGVFAAVCFASVGLIAAINGPFLAAGLARIFAPWVDIEYPTRTQITLEASEIVIQEGDSAAITAQLTGIIPDEATIYVRTGQGPARAIDLDVTDNTCTYTLASASRDFDYRIKAGDDRTNWQSVRVIPAPRIKEVQVQQVFPEYLGKESQTIQALTLTVPEATQVNWRLTLDRPINSARLIRDGHQPIDLQVSEDGSDVSFTQEVSDSRGYSFEWVDREHGFVFTSPRYYLQVASDQAPRVELTSPASNLVAMLGRPMTPKVRVQDDHGIASARVAYRVNQREEITAELADNLQNGQGEQALAWDYRAALADLAIGDTVALTIEVSDRYPGPQGPHVVRSETRRVTFVSKEQYLEQILKQTDRLLSRVQAIYRQQRAAHESVLELIPGDAGYTQACQLEAIRQEMVREQLIEIASQLKLLLEDLAANNVADAAQGQSLEHVRTTLEQIAQTHVAHSASLLRGQTAAADHDTAPAAEAVNTAARELGRLVMLRGIEAAQEVYAREARMFAQVQAAIRRDAVLSSSADQAQQLASRQDELAQWTDRLIADLQENMRYERRPLAVLRLVRSVKGLDEAQTSTQMRSAGQAMREGRIDQAQTIQAQLVGTLLGAEFSVRLSGAYATLMQTRSQIDFLIKAQAQLRQQGAALSASDFQKQQPQLDQVQQTLRKQLLTLLLPPVPAPQPVLFDESPPQAPPIQALLAEADRAMTDALSQLRAGNRDAASEHQQHSEQTLTQLLTFVDRWSVQLGLETQGLSTLVAATSDRMSQVESYEARVIGLLEKTDAAAAEKEKVDSLAQMQLILADELAGFKDDLARQHQAQADADLPPLLSRLADAQRAMNAGVESLNTNAADEAMGYQEQAADALAEALAITVAQHERLTMLQDLLMFQRSVGFANQYMGDIVQQQHDLLAITRASQTQDLAGQLPQFAHLRAAMIDVAPLLDLVAARLDVGTPLAFASADFEDAIASLSVGDKLDAIDAQDVAAESLAKVHALIRDMQSQTGYVAQIVAYLHASLSTTANLHDLQLELLSQTQSARAEQLPDLLARQDALFARAEAFGRELQIVTGKAEFLEAAGPMQAALTKLKEGQPAPAIEQMKLAAEALAQNEQSQLAVISVLHGLPAIELTTLSDPALKRLLDVLAVASSHKNLFLQTQVADHAAMDALAQEQGELSARTQALAKNGPAHPLLDAAERELASAVKAFSAADREALGLNQRTADMMLRHFIVEQALILDTSVPPPAASDPAETDESPGSDSESEFSAGFISDFVSGEVPKDKRTQWNVLADRNRAALNQNFARELPLEYRALLKNYYERVAK